MRGNVRGYVLAGGRSSRMGIDKGNLRLGGQSLLEIAVGKLRLVCEEVVVVGQRPLVPDGVRVIPDLRPGCGPMGGIEAALEDAGEGRAMFLPVDMPFLPGGLFERIAEHWLRTDARVCFAEVDGRAQPLVSLLRSDVLDEVRRALERGEYMVRPLLELAGRAGPSHGGRPRMVLTEILTAVRDSVWEGWRPNDEEWAQREVWFANLNTPEEFAWAESFAGASRGH